MNVSYWVAAQVPFGNSLEQTRSIQMVVSSNHLVRGALLQPSYHMSAKVLNEELRYEG